MDFEIGCDIAGEIEAKVIGPAVLGGQYRIKKIRDILGLSIFEVKTFRKHGLANIGRIDGKFNISMQRTKG